ncbi:MAG TPA: LacI family DNA-binding transcriptional regulator [Kineosporiaceae bacterium]|nr:LacI family DNA-binding transcriptional regulator [Kineosporiaceae bacterium]
MRATMKHVAARAGVSIKTVSNVVNGSERVAPETRRRVQAAIDELGFVPNATARSLRSGRSGVVALALPELDAPYFAELAQNVVEAAREHGWTVLVDATGGHAEQERLAASGIRPQFIDGLIFSPLALRAGDLPESGTGPPTVLLGERVTDAAVDLVTVDNHAVVATAVEHLAGLGRRRIAALGAQTTETGVTARLRLEGYHLAMARAGLPCDPGLVVAAASWHRTEGAAAARVLLDRVPDVDAVVCFNDLLALGVLRALADAGVRVPDDVAVVGVDDVEDGRFSRPSLTTVALDKAEIARTAVELLAARLEGARDAPPRAVVAGHRLVVRESTAGRGAATLSP